MATDYTKFRFREHTLADLDRLASSAGSRAQAAREAIQYWYVTVEEAAKLNAAMLSEEEWERLGHTGNPTLTIEAMGESTRLDWSDYLARELASAYEGKPLILPEHRAADKACKALAKKIANWGPIRGYALMAAVRYLWTFPTAGDPAWGPWYDPLVWLGPNVRPESEMRGKRIDAEEAVS